MVKIYKLPALFILCVLALSIMSCSKPQSGAESQSENIEEKESVVSAAEDIDPEQCYQEAMELISSGHTVDGIKKLALIPSYKDAEVYLYGYTYLEYFLGEWEAELSENFKKGTTVFPYEMKFTVSDKSIWLDTEINGFQRLRFPVTVEYTIWKDSKTQSGTEEYEGYLLLDFDEKSNMANGIIFGVEYGGIWYNFEKDSDNIASCSFSASDTDGNIDTDSNNTFNCRRITSQQHEDIKWDNSGKTYSYKDAENSSSLNNEASDQQSEGPEINESGSDNPAAQRAKDYLSYTAFSRTGLIEQLEYEGYSNYESQKAVDSLNVDWNEQALLKASEYLNYSAFSYSGLMNQLEYEGFSHSEAMYGVDNCGTNWNEQAAKKAREYREYGDFSDSELIDQLMYEGFSQSEAEYGVNSY